MQIVAGVSPASLAAVFAGIAGVPPASPAAVFAGIAGVSPASPAAGAGAFHRLKA